LTTEPYILSGIAPQGLCNALAGTFTQLQTIIHVAPRRQVYRQLMNELELPLKVPTGATHHHMQAQG
jgi:hypothetical protein